MRPGCPHRSSSSACRTTGAPGPRIPGTSTPRTCPGPQYGTSVTAVYTVAADLASQYGRRYDSVEQAPWTAYQKQTCTTTYGCVTAWRELYYDDAASLKLRYDLVNQRGLRGAGIWALGYDDTPPGAVPGAGGQVPPRHDGPDRRDHRALRDPARRRLRGPLEWQGREHDGHLRRPVIDGRRPVDQLADGDVRHEFDLPRRERACLRVPRPWPGHPRQRVRMGRDVDGNRAVADGRRLWHGAL